MQIRVYEFAKNDFVTSFCHMWHFYLCMWHDIYACDKFCHILNQLTILSLYKYPWIVHFIPRFAYLCNIYAYFYPIFYTHLKMSHFLSHPQTPSYQRFRSFVTSMWQNLGQKSYAQPLHNPWGCRVYMRCDKILSHLGCISNYILFLFFILITI